MSGDAGCAKRLLYALFVMVVKPISDLRLLISGLCVLLLALSIPADAQQPKKVSRLGLLISAPSLSLPAHGSTQLAC